jgi:hypothetical protein
MQTRFLPLALALATLASCAGVEVGATASVATGPTTGAVSVDLFHEALAPYGMWIQRPGFGWVWVPSSAVVGSDFVPYATAGHWDYSNVGWMFISDWDWGWAPFHYGRWYFDPLYSWVWVPDSIWGPAWVDWRIGGGLIAWAPLPPRTHRVPMRDHRTRWMFVASRDFRQPAIGRHLLAPSERRLEATAPVSGEVRVGRATWFTGPSRAGVETATRSRIEPIQVAPPRPGVATRMRIEGHRAVAVPVQRRPGRAAAGPPAPARPSFPPDREQGRGRQDRRQRL